MVAFLSLWLSQESWTVALRECCPGRNASALDCFRSTVSLVGLVRPDSLTEEAMLFFEEYELEVGSVTSSGCVLGLLPAENPGEIR